MAGDVHDPADERSGRCDRIRRPPCSRYCTPAEVLDDEHLRERGSFAPLSDTRGDFAVLNPPFRFDGLDCSALPIVGGLGEHTREVLESMLAIDAEQIASLRKAGAFGDS